MARLDAAVDRADPDAIHDLAAAYSGLTVRTSLIAYDFFVDIQDVLQWVFTHLHDLHLPGNITPSPVITSTFGMLIAEASDGGLPGPLSEMLLTDAPLMVQVGVLRRFALLGRVEDDDLVEQVRSLWGKVLSQQDLPAHEELIAVIGTWAANPAFTRSLGIGWVLDQLELVIDSSGVVDGPGVVLEGLAELFEDAPYLAERVTSIVLRVRRRGLLNAGDGDSVQHLLAVLETVAEQPADFAQLRSELVADRVIGPLSRFA